MARLSLRDGPQPRRTPRHQVDEYCRFGGSIDGRPCPWCAAEKRRQAQAASK